MAAARDTARNTFWQVVASEAPEVITSLAEDVYPVWIGEPDPQPIWGAHRVVPTAVSDLVEKLEFAKAILEDHPDIDPTAYRDRLIREWESDHPSQAGQLLRAVALAEWIERWRLFSVHPGDAWCVEAATWAMYHWEKNPDALADRTWGARHPYSDALIGEFTFKADPWRPQVETWGEFRERIEHQLGRYLVEYQRGVKAEQRRARHPFAKSASPHHYQWLVAYQIHERSYAEIARASQPRRTSEPGHVDTKTQREAIRELAQLIGLRLRKTRRGRPSRKPGL